MIESMSEVLSRRLCNRDPGKMNIEGQSMAERVCDRLIMASASFDPEISLAAIREIFDRIDGRPVRYVADLSNLECSPWDADEMAADGGGPSE